MTVLVPSALQWSGSEEGEQQWSSLSHLIHPVTRGEWVCRVRCSQWVDSLAAPPHLSLRCLRWRGSELWWLRVCLITSHCDYRGEESVVWIVSGGLSGAQLLATMCHSLNKHWSISNNAGEWRLFVSSAVQCPDESYWSYAYDSGHLCVWGGETPEKQRNSSGERRRQGGGSC